MALFHIQNAALKSICLQLIFRYLFLGLFRIFFFLLNQCWEQFIPEGSSTLFEPKFYSRLQVNDKNSLFILSEFRPCELGERGIWQCTGMPKDGAK